MDGFGRVWTVFQGPISAFPLPGGLQLSLPKTALERNVGGTDRGTDRERSPWCPGCDGLAPDKRQENPLKSKQLRDETCVSAREAARLVDLSFPHQPDRVDICFHVHISGERSAHYPFTEGLNTTPL